MGARRQNVVQTDNEVRNPVGHASARPRAGRARSVVRSPQWRCRPVISGLPSQEKHFATNWICRAESESPVGNRVLEMVPNAGMIFPESRSLPCVPAGRCSPDCGPTLRLGRGRSERDAPRRSPPPPWHAMSCHWFFHVLKTRAEYRSSRRGPERSQRQGDVKGVGDKGRIQLEQSAEKTVATGNPQASGRSSPSHGCRLVLGVDNMKTGLSGREPLNEAAEPGRDLLEVDVFDVA